jgi:hypothetical protein
MKFLCFTAMLQVCVRIYEDAFRFMSLSHLGTERFSWVQLEPIPGGYRRDYLQKRKKGLSGVIEFTAVRERNLTSSTNVRKYYTELGVREPFLKVRDYFTATSFNRTMSVFNFRIITENYIMRSFIIFAFQYVGIFFKSGRSEKLIRYSCRDALREEIVWSMSV